jgi:hypothetical protein
VDRVTAVALAAGDRVAAVVEAALEVAVADQVVAPAGLVAAEVAVEAAEARVVEVPAAAVAAGVAAAARLLVITTRVTATIPAIRIRTIRAIPGKGKGKTND